MRFKIYTYLNWSCCQPLSNNRDFVSGLTQAGEPSLFFMIKTRVGLQLIRLDLIPFLNCFNGDKTISFLFLDILIAATYSSDMSFVLIGYGKMSIKLISYKFTRKVVVSP